MRVGSTHTEVSKAKISKSMKGKHNNPNWGGVKSVPVPVVNKTLKKTYPSMTKAAEAISCSVSDIYNACVNYSGQQTAGGFYWEFV